MVMHLSSTDVFQKRRDSEFDTVARLVCEHAEHDRAAGQVAHRLAAFRDQS